MKQTNDETNIQAIEDPMDIPWVGMHEKRYQDILISNQEQITITTKFTSVSGDQVLKTAQKKPTNYTKFNFLNSSVFYEVLFRRDFSKLCPNSNKMLVYKKG
jgi:outer membrane lipoprotein-sorting protein